MMSGCLLYAKSVNVIGGSRTEHFLIENVDIYQCNIDKITHIYESRPKKTCLWGFQPGKTAQPQKLARGLKFRK